MNRIHLGVHVLLLASTLSLAAQAQNEAPTGPVNAPTGLPATEAQPAQTTWLTRPTMTGDWGGLRSRLLQEGIDIKGSYVGEWANNFAGGKRIGGDLANQLTIGAILDMGKLAGLQGGTFTLTLNQRFGRSTSADYIGNRLAVQEIYGAGENFRVAEISYEQKFAAGVVKAKAGYYAMGDDFGSTPILCTFQNTGFCSHQQSLPNNSGWSDYPNAHWGGRLRVNLPNELYGAIGVFDVNPTYGLHQNGLKFGFSGSTGVIIPVEFGKTIRIGADGLPGHYKIGAYYDTTTGPDIAVPATTRTGRYGGYVLTDQMVMRFQPGTDRGLIIVLTGSISDSRTAPMPGYLVAALIAQGPFKSRPKDAVGIGFVRAWANHRAATVRETQLTAAGEQPALEMGENVVELAYGVQVTPWAVVRPNLQYVNNPGAFSFTHIPNAWVFGLQTKLAF